MSVSYGKNTINGRSTGSAWLTKIDGPLEDWSQLDVVGCRAPDEGTIEVPHEFSACSGELTITYSSTGDVLYSSRAARNGTP